MEGTVPGTDAVMSMTAGDLKDMAENLNAYILHMERRATPSIW